MITAACSTAACSIASRRASLRFPATVLSVLALSAALLLGGCSSMPPAPENEDVAAVEMRLEGSVTAIDSANRLLTVTDDTGYSLQVHADDAIRNFDQIRKGDVVYVDYIVAIAAGIQPAGSGVKPGRYDSSDINVARTGEKPYADDIQTTVLVAPIIGVDLANDTLTVEDPQGTPWTFYVEKPENQARLATLNPGDMLQVTFTTVRAVGVEKAL